jgi:hypothetical protein
LALLNSAAASASRSRTSDSFLEQAATGSQDGRTAEQVHGMQLVMMRSCPTQHGKNK